MASFVIAIGFILANEGGYSFRADDRGGPTNWGITQATLANFRGKPVSAFDMQALSQAEAENIYLQNYWSPLKLNQFENQELATIVFDCAVNQGPGTAAMHLQRALGVDPDGVIGAATLNAVNSADAGKIKEEFFKQVQSHYADIVKRDSTQSGNLPGWINRTHRYLAFL